MTNANIGTWDITLEDDKHDQVLRLQFDDQIQLQKFILSLTVEQLLASHIYDPDQHSMNGKTYLYHCFK